MKRHRRSLREVTECLIARYAFEPWFVQAVWNKGEDHVVLRVFAHCPFKTHRPVLDAEVRMEVFEPPRARKPELAITKATPKKRTPPPIPKAPKPVMGDVAAVVRRIKEDRKLLRVVGEFRDGILGPSSPIGACFMICAPLAAYLWTAHKISCEVVEFDFGFTNHFAITLSDGRLLDPTADQFNEFGVTFPTVYLGEMPATYLRWIEEGKKTAVGT